MATSTAISGVVVRVKTDRGFGFIKPNGGGADVFFHCGQLQGLEFAEHLLQRDVMFTSEETDKGTRATRVWATT